MGIRRLFILLSYAFCAGHGGATEFPQASLSNGSVRATVYLPDAERGYYRGSRFDWSGVIAKLEYAGHNYFGVWFPKYDPTLHDAITGPVEEFRGADEGGLGYAKAALGDLFVKIGVGVLRKPDNAPYSFARSYQIVNNGKWVVRAAADRVEFVQELKAIDGYRYVYSKTVRLSSKKPELILEHTLTNTGTRAIDTQVYNHDFYVIDGQPTGPDFVVRFPFQPHAGGDLNGAEAVGNELVFRRELQARPDSAAGDIVGYGRDAKYNDIRVENRKTGAGVREIGDHPIAKLYFWSVRTTLCPEVYTAVRVEPGKKAQWRITYQFYTLGDGRK